ncbi:MAG: hypothetical protein AB1486_10785 [Planctomycetota bacterium]
MPGLAALLSSLLFLAAPVAGEPIDPLDLAILYAGNPGSEREDDFVLFLEKHFGVVETAHFSKVTAETAEPYDVVIFDWTSLYKRDGEKIEWEGAMPETPKLGPSYAKSTVLIGGMGGQIGDSVKLKIGWL